MTSLLAYIPFVDPMPIFHRWWYLLIIPLSFGISVVYKAMRLHSLDRFWSRVSIMTIQIVVAMIALGACLVVLVELIVPLVPVDR